MPVFKKYIHADSNESVNIVDGYDTSKVFTINLKMDGSINTCLHNISIKLKELTAATDSKEVPTEVTFRITSDIEGNNCIIGDTTKKIYLGLSDLNYGLVLHKINTGVSLSPAKVYVFCKTNTGTAIVDSVSVVYER